MSELLNQLFSFYRKPVVNVTPERAIDLNEVYELITGSDYKEVTEMYRSLSGDEAKEFKGKSFDYVTFSGTFVKRNSNDLIQHSGLMVFDFDDLNEDMRFLKQSLLFDPYIQTQLLFDSPGGKGFKWVIEVDLSELTHLQYFNAVAKYLESEYGIEVDQSGKDVGRACFLCHDSNAYINYQQTKGEYQFDAKYWYGMSKDRTEYDDTFVMEDLGESKDQLERLIKELERTKKDITSEYHEWVNIGFALYNAFGEGGRDYFHRISKFHPDYTLEDCDKKYDKCADTRGSFNLGTVFFYAKKAGIIVSKTQNNRLPQFPQFPQFPQLPPLLEKITDCARNDIERDILLLGGVTAFSSALPKVYGVYGGKIVYPNLFTFITANAGTGKGVLSDCRGLVSNVDAYFKSEGCNNTLLNQPIVFNYQNGEKAPVRDACKELAGCKQFFFIPGNTSTSGTYEIMHCNDGYGFLIETEGDTLSNIFKTDYGNYSEMLRKAFQNEPLSLFRRTGKEHREVKEPKLSVLLSGTVNQIAPLVQDAENGLFSRFIYYRMPSNVNWIDPFASSKDLPLGIKFDAIGNEYFDLYANLINAGGIKFTLTPDQEQRFSEVMSPKLSYASEFIGPQFIGVVTRQGLIGYKIAMVLTALRLSPTGEMPSIVECNDYDFETALEIIDVTLQHAEKVYDELPHKHSKVKSNAQKKLFYDNLPASFDRQTYIEVAESLKIKERTAEGYITQLCRGLLLDRVKQGEYRKTQ